MVSKGRVSIRFKAEMARAAMPWNVKGTARP